MKKAQCVALSLFMFAISAFAMFTNPFGTDLSRRADAAAENLPESGTFRLPASLRIIGEEAFEGTSVAALILEDEVETVDSRAFAGTENLQEVYIPGSVETLVDDAFDGAEHLTVYGIEGSAAADWAARLGFRFVLRDIWTDAVLPQASQALAMLLLLLAFAVWAADRQKSFKTGITATAVEFIALFHKKRAELFVRNLCFP